MKKIYLSILAGVFTIQFASAQLTLTKAFNEPVVGDVYNKQRRDSVSALPKNTGASQVWNFTSLVYNAGTAQSTFMAVAGTPSAAAYPTATIAEFLGGTSYNYWKSTATQFEALGGVDFPFAGVTTNFTNTAIAEIWPIAMGYSNTDPLSGTCAYTGFPGVENGTIKTNATGTGTLQLPGGITLTNVLQTKTTETIVAVVAGNTITVVNTDWKYYHSTQKFPVLLISYQDIQGAVTNFSGDIFVNSAALTGVNENTLLSDYAVYPNPVTNKVNVALTNNSGENVFVQILNNMGQLVRSENLGNTATIHSSIDVSDLAKGIYFVKTSVGSRTGIKKVIVE